MKQSHALAWCVAATLWLAMLSPARSAEVQISGVSPSATQAAASNSVLKSGAGSLYNLTVTVGATTGWVMIFDATALPSNGATGASLKFCIPVNSDGTKGAVSMAWVTPVLFTTGITVGFSSTACNSLTASATAFFYGQVQ